MRGLSPVTASGGHSSSRCAGLSLSWPLLLQSTSSRRAGSVIVAHGPSRSAACGILPDQGSNPCPLYWQADSQPLRHQGSPSFIFFNHLIIKVIALTDNLKYKEHILNHSYKHSEITTINTLVYVLLVFFPYLFCIYFPKLTLNSLSLITYFLFTQKYIVSILPCHSLFS